MLRVLIVFLCFIAMIGCSRQQYLSNDLNSDPFYFTTKKGTLYEFSGSVSQVTSQKISNILKHNQDVLFTANSNSLSLMSDNGSIIHRYESNQSIISATVSPDLNIYYFVNNLGELYKFIISDSNLVKIDIDKLYPLPSQIIFGKDNELIYHDHNFIYSLNLDSLQTEKLINEVMPIESIAYQKVADEIFFSTSTDGKIFCINKEYKAPVIYIESISASGSHISINNSKNEFYYTRSDFRNTTIYKHDFISRESNEVATLYNIQKIYNFSF